MNNPSQTAFATALDFPKLMLSLSSLKDFSAFSIGGIVVQEWSRLKRQTGLNFWSQLAGSDEKLADSRRNFDLDFGAR